MCMLATAENFQSDPDLRSPQRHLGFAQLPYSNKQCTWASHGAWLLKLLLLLLLLLGGDRTSSPPTVF